MGRWLSAFILRMLGWHTDGSLPDGIRKAVVVAAPHTSMWDFVIGRLTFWAIRVNIRFLIKEESFVFPLGILLKWIGGVPVARGRYKSNVVSDVTELFRKSDDLVVVITPEGTRRKVEQWKKGFYLIAVAANVPIALGYIDYGKKTGGIGPVIYPSGDFDKDIRIMQDFYRNMTAKHPERFNLSETAQ
jgi:1-acyl-sn-glycerol-3-phosphate acyltransferase